jgi:hypothetical protein
MVTMKPAREPNGRVILCLVAQTKRCCIKSRKRSNRTKIRVLSKHQDQTSAGDSPALPWTSRMRKTFTILRIYRKLKAVIASI